MKTGRPFNSMWWTTLGEFPVQDVIDGEQVSYILRVGYLTVIENDQDQLYAYLIDTNNNVVMNGSIKRTGSVWHGQNGIGNGIKQLLTADGLAKCRDIALRAEKMKVFA